MKLNISLPDEDVAALDRYAAAAGDPTGSEAIRRAIRLLRDPQLDDGSVAGVENPHGDAAAREETTADGLADAVR